MDKRILEVSGASFQLIWKKPKLRHRLCISCSIGRQDYLLIFDRKDGGNFHKILLDGFQHPTIYVGDGPTIYLLEEFENGQCHEVYKYKLPEYDSVIPQVLDRSKMDKSSPLSSSKIVPATIGYGQRIIIFSTLVTFFDVVDEDDCVDFEIYDPKGEKTVRLPQLCLRYHNPDQCELVDPKCDTSISFELMAYSNPFPNCRPTRLRIEGFCLFKSDTLVVQTDLGQSFSLLLSSQDAKWELFVDEDHGLLHHESRFYVKDGVCVDSNGAYRMERQVRVPSSVISDSGEKRVPFGVTVPFLRASSMIICDDDGVGCKVQVGTDEEEVNSYLSIELLEFEFSKFPRHDFSTYTEEKETDSCDELQKWAKITNFYNIAIDVPRVRWGLNRFGIYPCSIFGVFSI